VCIDLVKIALGIKTAKGLNLIGWVVIVFFKSSKLQVRNISGIKPTRPTPLKAWSSGKKVLNPREPGFEPLDWSIIPSP